jgi:DNA-binding Lrp family transcriptional regulator
MAVNAYILIQTEVGKANDVVTAARTVEGVSAADEVTGPYDVIVRCAAASVDDLGAMVIGAIQKVPGITRTLTCPVVNF